MGLLINYQSHELGERVSLGYNIGYDHINSDNILTYSVALGFSVNEKFGMYIEPFGFWEEGDLVIILMLA